MNKVDDVLKNLIKNNSTPGLRYLIFTKDRLLHQFTGGFANIQKQTMVNETTAFHAFSVTKTCTALAVLQLVQNGKLKLDDAVVKHLPSFPYRGQITIQHLLNHTAGIPAPIPLNWIHLIQEHETFERDKFFNRVMAKYNRTQFKPNEKFSYSNLGYVLLGQLIEKVSGISYEQYLTHNILEPLKLTSADAGFQITRQLQLASGYNKRFSFSNLLLSFLIDKPKFMDRPQGNWQAFKDYYVSGVSYGGLLATPHALARYIQEFLNPDSQLISEPFKKLMFTENHTNNNKATGMCLSWYCAKFKNENYFTHAGGGGGYYCEVRIYPDLGIGSVIMFNRTGMTDERFLDKVDSHFL